MARLAAPVLLHAAPRERCVRVRHHLRVAANHNPRGLRRKRHARRGLQATLLDREGDASVERAGFIFPAHERDQAHLLLVLAEQPREAVSVGQLLGMAHRVNQDDLLEALPGYLGLQDRQERADSGSRRYQPEVLPVGDFREHEKPRRPRRKVNRVPRSQLAQALRERPVGQRHVIELVRTFLRRVHERVRARHHLALHRERELGELSRLERSDVGLHLQREQGLRPALLVDDGAFDPLLHDSPQEDSLQQEWFHGERFYLAAHRDDAAAAPVVAVVGEFESVDAPQGDAPVLVARGAKRHALHGLVEELQAVALAGARARSDRALARPHAVEPQPGEKSHCGERPCFPHWYATTRRVGKESPPIYAICRARRQWLPAPLPRDSLPMKIERSVVLGLPAAVLAGLILFTYLSYRNDMVAEEARVSSGSRVVDTPCGPIEYALIGRGAPVLLVHGAGGGFDQGLEFGRPLAERGFTVIAVSR